MKTTWKQGDRVVVIENEQHATVEKVRLDDRGEPLIDLHLDDESYTTCGHGYWIARSFELREEGEEA